MTEEKRWRQGEFCWHELGTRDLEGAKRFYAAVFGWTYHDAEMPGGVGPYTIFELAGQEIAGAYLLAGSRFEGVPPHWAVYVAVDHVDSAAALGRSLGATLLQPPSDVPGVGRMAVLRDPQGATFALFQPGEHPGAARFDGGPYSFCWDELLTRDVDGMRHFYKGTVGWEIKEQPVGEHDYTEWLVGERPVGGMLEMGAEWGDIPSHWLSYVAVPDCEEIVARAKKFGARVFVDPTDVPGVGRFAILADPSGAALSVIRLG